MALFIELIMYSSSTSKLPTCTHAPARSSPKFMNFHQSLLLPSAREVAVVRDRNGCGWAGTENKPWGKDKLLARVGSQIQEMRRVFTILARYALSFLRVLGKPKLLGFSPLPFDFAYAAR